jgi:hypothetical protein
MTCCDHPSTRLCTHARPDGSHGPFWLACSCGAFTPYAATASEAWALESALSLPGRGNSPAVPPAVGGLSSEVIQ